jgi:phage repressor protein C with HTH and peptisase S24 domain
MDKAWFREALRRVGESQADLARELGLAPSAISRILTGERQIKAAEAVHLANYLGVSSEEVLRHATAAGTAAAPEFVRRGRPPRAAEAILTERQDMIPILGGAGPGVLFEDQPIGRTPRPPALAGVRGAYAVYAAGDAMEPRYMPGWLLYVHPNKPVIRGRDVVIVRKDSTVLIGQLTGTDRGAITIRQFNPVQTLEIPQEEMVAYHLVVGVSHEG